ncbi:MAG: hypothetical protein DMG07_14815 [Acidobacteria bacterium]|nr:MAG: hypothetical protein DMG07_14815 [Acidobacteriota bacterium]
MKPRSSISGKTNDDRVALETSAPSRIVSPLLNIRKKPTILLTVLSILNQPVGLRSIKPSPNTWVSTIGSCCPAPRVLSAGLVRCRTT